MTDDWIDALAALIAAKARFLVVGAHALAVHGVPRATQDLDVWIDASPENAARVWNALAAFGAPLNDLGIRVDDFSTEGNVIQLGLPPRRIDVLTTISGVDTFADAWKHRVERVLHGHRVPFIGREALIANKRAAGRLRDLADIEALGEGK
jgi:hypothetical protein